MIVDKQQHWLRDNALKVLDSVVDSIITIDDQGSIQSVNESTEKLFGYTADELVGQPLTILMPEPYRSQHQSYINKYLLSGDAKIIGLGRELVATTKTGSQRPAQQSSCHRAGDQRAHGRNSSQQRNEENAFSIVGRSSAFVDQDRRNGNRGLIWPASRY